MAPKKLTKETDENYWRTRIEDASLDEGNWTVKVVIIEAAGSEQDRIYLNKFETFAAEEKRFVIKNICRSETIFMINQLGGEKKIRDENLRVFEEGQAYIKDKKDIPADLQALIIKHLILKLKNEYLFIMRQKLEVKEGMRCESATMIDKAEVRGTVNVKPPETTTPPPKGKKKGEPDPSTLIPETNDGKKYNTSLRLRGEEWRDKVYVDDFPTDGPNIYVAITGFVEPNLPACLTKIGIPLTAVVQIRIDPNLIKVPSTLFRAATKRGQSQTDGMTEKTLKFWEDLQDLRLNKDSADNFKNTAFVVFSPPYWDSEHLTGNPEKIYDELCFLMYDLQDLTRQHLNFLENMDIICLPQGTAEVRCKKLYNHQINDLPLECITTYSILDSLLQAVCRSEDDEKNSRSLLSVDSTPSQPIQDGHIEDKVKAAETFVENMFNTLCKTEEDKNSYRSTYGKEYENHKDPVVINYGDFAKYTTFQLGNINMDNIIWSTLYGLPLNKIWETQNRPVEDLEAKINFHVNVLLSCFKREDVETAELNRLLHVLACRKLYNNRSSLKIQHLQSATITEFKNNYLKRSVLAEPLPRCPSLHQSCSFSSPSYPSMTKIENASDTSKWADPEVDKIKFLFDCPDISELVSAAEIENNQPITHMIDNYDYFEDFSGICAFQILLDAFNAFNCVDYKYCEVTDCIILMFFNSQDKDGISREEWRCHLPTPLCLQDFFDFVLEEHYDWIQNEERIYDEKKDLVTKSDCKDLFDLFAAKSCIENTDVQMDFLMEGSLKYQEIAQLEETSEETLLHVPGKSTKSSVSPNSMDMDSKSSRKTKSPSVTPKHLRQSFVAIGATSNSSLQAPKKPFLGYDLSDRRVEVFGKDSSFFSRDGTRVSSTYTLLIPWNQEYVILSVATGNGNNEFYIHRALGECRAPTIIDTCESFRITTKDQVMIYIKKQTNRVPFLTSTLSNDKLVDLKSAEANLETKPFYYSLYVTWPNGLITESVHVNLTSDISHIKQYFVNPLAHLKEKMRCISLNGEVIVFGISGDIEVLRPDGTYIKINKCDMKPVLSQELDDSHSEASSDKTKKVKGKEKGKEKPHKDSSKTSKQAYYEDTDKQTEEKLPEFKLFVEEFEVIETNGLRQKWVNDNFFDIEKLLIRTATDYCLGEVFSRRMDGTNILLNKEGVQIVTFPNNTRIITKFIIENDEVFPEWTDEEKEYFELLGSDSGDTETTKSKASKNYNDDGSLSSSNSKKNAYYKDHRTDGYVSVNISYTIEHANFTTVIINKHNGNIYIDSPNNTSVVMLADNKYETMLDSVTTAKFDGENIQIKYEACTKCRSYTTCDIFIKRSQECSTTDIGQHWLKLKDSFCKKIAVDEEGSIILLDEPCSKEMFNSEEVLDPEEDDNEDKPDTKSESSIASHGKCRDIYQAKCNRFFILRRDLNCSELVHRGLVEKYKCACRWQPWCSINQYDTFGDYRSLHSILTPVLLTETEKWLMESKLANKPRHLTYKDLKKDCNKGFYHWMRPYERFEPKPKKPSNVLPPRLPRAFILRTLEQQWSETEREQLKGGRELLSAILQYRQVMAADSEALLRTPIIDPRTQDERIIDDIIQALGHRIYKDLKSRLEEDVRRRARATVTTAPAPFAEEMSVEGEMVEEVDEAKALEEERKSLLNELEAVDKMSPSLKKYWRQRAEERKEEDFYRYLLREGSVPPYFRNVLGGAIWWEMNDTAGEAVSEAERRKMSCVCAGEEGTSRRTDPEGYTVTPPFL